MFGLLGSIIVLAIGFVAGLLVGRKHKALADQAATSARVIASNAQAELARLKQQLESGKK